MSKNNNHKEVVDNELAAFLADADKRWEEILAKPRARSRSREIVKLRNEIKIAIKQHLLRQRTTNLKDSKVNVLRVILSKVFGFFGVSRSNE